MTRLALLASLLTVFLAAQPAQDAHGALPRATSPAKLLKLRPTPYCQPACTPKKKKPRGKPRLYFVQDIREY